MVHNGKEFQMKLDRNMKLSEVFIYNIKTDMLCPNRGGPTEIDQQT